MRLARDPMLNNVVERLVLLETKDREVLCLREITHCIDIEADVCIARKV